MLEIIHFSCVGLTSQYIVDSIPRLREPLTKIARIFSSLDDEVRRANWTLTKSAMIYRQSVDPSFLVQGEIDLEIEEFVRTGSLKKTLAISASPSQKEESLRKAKDEINEDMLSPQKNNKCAAALDGISTEIASDKPASLHQDPALTKPPSRPGSYSHCGIASCGSLRFPDMPHDHESFRTLSPEQTLALTLKLPAVDKARQVLPVSQLSAREKGLRDLVEFRKGKEGMAEVVKTSVFISPSGKKTNPNHTRGNLNSNSTSVQKRLFQETAKATIQSVSLSELPDLILTRPPKK